MIRVLVDSAADYFTEELAARNIEMVPLTITINDDKNYRDEYDLARQDLYRMMIEEKCTVKTSQPSPEEFAKVFTKIKEAGDEVICILLSSTLSGTCQSAVLAKQIVDYDKIHIIDSLSATGGVQILADYAQRLIKENYSAEEIVKKIEEKKSKIRILAMVDTLKYLYLGGRVSRTTAVVGDAVNIKPCITVSQEGAVEVVGKYLGASRAIKDLLKQIKAAKIDEEFPVYTVYSYVDGNEKKLRKMMEDDGIRVDGACGLGATLGVHVGPGACGYIYMEK